NKFIHARTVETAEAALVCAAAETIEGAEDPIPLVSGPACSASARPLMLRLPGVEGAVDSSAFSRLPPSPSAAFRLRLQPFEPVRHESSSSLSGFVTY